ncbi:glycosyltransferase [Geodermatophilus sp. SYSU D00779]
MSEPLVSILVPTYNGERFIDAALCSALAQTHRNIEVIVGDDASTDGTPEILAAFAAADPRVRVIRHPDNIGAFENPKQLFQAARGEFIKFLLHDDVLAPNCVRTLVRGMEASPGTSMAFSRRELIGEDGQPVAGHQFPQLADRPGLIEGRALGDLVLENCANVIGELTTVLFRRVDVDAATLWQIDGRRLAANGDVALWLRLLARGHAFYTPEVLSSFRRHPNQTSYDPRIMAGGIRDWPSLVDWGRRQGFVLDPTQQRRAHAQVLITAAQVHAAFLDSPDCTRALEAIHLATARLIELQTANDTRLTRPLTDRAHGQAVLGRFEQELDVWGQTRSFALATVALDPIEVTATVEALRDVAAAGAAERLVLAVRPADAARIVPLVEDALSTGPEIDLDLVPVDDPAVLLSEPWLAVAPRGHTWHRSLADAVWTFDVARPRSETWSPLPSHAPQSRGDEHYSLVAE